MDETSIITEKGGRKMKVIEILVKAFRSLTPTQLKRLKRHEEKKTPICCGETSYIYTDGKGGG